jgi:PAS domain S-box-containing protein
MIKAIRNINKNIPILVLSAYNESGFFMESIKLGVEGYLLKPIDMNQYLLVLEKVVKQIRLSYEVKKSMFLLEQYKQIADKSAIVVVTDKDKVIKYINEAFCEITQYSKDELIGKKYTQAITSEQSKELYDDIWDTIRTKKEVWQGVLKFSSRYGKLHYLKTTVKPILDQDQNIIEYMTLGDDITPIMNHHRQLNDAIKSYENPLVVYMKIKDYNMLEEFYDNKTIETIQNKIRKYLENTIHKICNFKTVFQLRNGEYAVANEQKKCMNNKEEFVKQLLLFQDKIRDGSVSVDDIEYDILSSINMI